MAQYCPTCFNNTLHLQPKGVVHVFINGKKMDAGRFLFNLEDRDKRFVINDLEKKIEEFFSWYGNFKNKEAIKKIELISSDMFCESGCSFPVGQKFSMIDILVPREVIAKIAKKMGEKYSLEVEF